MQKEELEKASNVAQGMDSYAFLDAILEERPDLKEQVDSGAVKPFFPGQGYSAYTVIIGDEVFKTSQYYAWPGVEPEDLVLGIERERNLLEYLKGMQLPVPEVTHVGRTLPFFGMQRLSGKVLDRHDIEQLAPDDKRQLAKDIATFCADLANAVPLDDARKMGLDVAPAEKMFDPRHIQAQLTEPRVREALGSRYDFFKGAVGEYIAFQEKEHRAGSQYLMHCDLKETCSGIRRRRGFPAASISG